MTFEEAVAVGKADDRRRGALTGDRDPPNVVLPRIGAGVRVRLHKAVLHEASSVDTFGINS